MPVFDQEFINTAEAGGVCADPFDGIFEDLNSAGYSQSITFLTAEKRYTICGIRHPKLGADVLAFFN